MDTIRHGFMFIKLFMKSLKNCLHNEVCSNFKISYNIQFWFHISVLKAILALETKIEANRSISSAITVIQTFHWFLNVKSHLQIVLFYKKCRSNTTELNKLKFCVLSFEIIRNRFEVKYLRVTILLGQKILK